MEGRENMGDVVRNVTKLSKYTGLLKFYREKFLRSWNFDCSYFIILNTVLNVSHPSPPFLTQFVGASIFYNVYVQKFHLSYI